jgi:hypothetical protein
MTSLSGGNQPDRDVSESQPGLGPSNLGLGREARILGPDVDATQRDKPAWQPMETAPKDGTSVWVYVAATHGLGAFCHTASYHPETGWARHDLRAVTAWMALR